MTQNLLQGWQFDNRFTRELPADPNPVNRPRPVHRACYSRVRPRAVAEPVCLAYSADMARTLDLAPQACESDQFAQVFSGNHPLPGMDPHATCYGGHQFGVWAGQLGDGRAINLGEIVNSHGQRWILQLKGAGPTPYSRSADGLAVLRSSVREFLCSEAMHHLAVPTTRALSLVGTGERVLRDMFYDGRPRHEPGAVVCRVAPSFTRFGHFEIFRQRGDHQLLARLADYTIETDFPHLGAPSRDTYIAWFEEVCRRTATLIVDWMRVGFVHGVLNTDNMSILGLTIDYGPYGWIEDFDPQWTPNTTDAASRRYCFAQQPDIGLWNLAQLANAIYPLIEDVAPLEQALDQYRSCYERQWRSMISAKLGCRDFDTATDTALVEDLFGLLAAVETDMTLFFRRLATAATDATAADPAALFMDCYYQPRQIDDSYRAQLAAWLGRYRERLARDGLPESVRVENMHRVNPKYVLRNYLAQLAIDEAEQGDPSMIHELLDTLRRPYDEQPEREEFAGKRPEWARHRAGCSMLSCSS